MFEIVELQEALHAVILGIMLRAVTCTVQIELVPQLRWLSELRRLSELLPTEIQYCLLAHSISGGCTLWTTNTASSSSSSSSSSAAAAAASCCGMPGSGDGRGSRL